MASMANIVATVASSVVAPDSAVGPCSAFLAGLNDDLPRLRSAHLSLI
jgi:hypothetical protein